MVEHKKIVILSGLVLLGCSALLLFPREKPADAVAEEPPAPALISAENKAIPRRSVTPENAGEAHTDVNDCARLDEVLDDGRLAEALAEARRLADHPDRDVRMQVVYALDWIGTDAIGDLVRLIGDPDQEVSSLAASCFWEKLEDLEDTDLQLEFLAIPLSHPSPVIQVHAVEILGFLPPEKSLPVLIEKLEQSTDPLLQIAIRNNLYFLSGGEEHSTPAEWSAWFIENKAALEQQEENIRPGEPAADQ